MVSLHAFWLKHSDLLWWALGLVGLILLSTFFSLAETSLMAVNRYRLRHLARSGNRFAQLTQKMLERPDRLLAAILIGNTFATIFASSIATYIAVRIFGNVGVVIATIILTFLILIFAEITPKTLAALHPQPIAFLICLPLRLLQKILHPIVLLVNGISNSILFLLGVRVKHRHTVESLNTEELRTVVYESVPHVESQESSKRQPKDMLLGILDLSLMTVKDVMLPRNEIVGIDLDSPWSEVMKVIIAGVHTRFPVYHGSIDQVLGVLNLRTAVKLLSQNRLTPKTIVQSLLEPYFIPESTSLHTQLHEFRQHQRRLALVVDEYGDILGVVTLEDILEEIVGEIDIDSTSIQRLVHPQEEGVYLVDGIVSVRELNKYLNWTLPLDGPKTLSGLVLEYLETIPSGQVCLQINDYRLEVLSIHDNRIVQVKITLEE